MKRAGTLARRPPNLADGTCTMALSGVLRGRPASHSGASIDGPEGPSDIDKTLFYDPP
jgi:hypothetical protein